MEDYVSDVDACRICGRTDFPHSCLPPLVILNARYFCPDGERHVATRRRWWQRRPRCERCGEAVNNAHSSPPDAQG